MSLRSVRQIGTVIQNGVLFDAKNWTATTMNPEDLLRSVQRLFALLEERRVDYVLVGGIALLHYEEGRNTQDLDLLMSVASLDALPELDISSRDNDFVRATYEGLQVDILLTDNPLFHRVLSDHSQHQRFLDQDVPIATVEGLLLLKLYALPSLYRQGNFARVGLYENDIATLLHAYPTDAAALLAMLTDYVSDSVLAEIHNVLADVQQRITRFSKGER